MVKNTKFDLDLEYGQIREKRIEKLLKESKIDYIEASTLEEAANKAVKALKEIKK